MKATDDPIVQAQTLNAELRQDIAADLDGVLTEIRRFCDGLVLDGAGQASRAELLLAVRAFVLAKFDQRLAVRQPEAAIVTQLTRLVRDASWLLNDGGDRLGWGSNRNDWNRAAEPFVTRRFGPPVQTTEDPLPRADEVRGILSPEAPLPTIQQEEE